MEISFTPALAKDLLDYEEAQFNILPAERTGHTPRVEIPVVWYIVERAQVSVGGGVA